MTDSIDRFEGEWAPLAMDHPCVIESKVNELPDAPSVEHALLAAKTHDRDAQRQILTADVKQARGLGLRTPARHNWHEIELRTLRYLLELKYAKEEYGEVLRRTGKAFLVDGGCGNDYWGMVDNEGENHHGLLLMEVREQQLRG